MKKLNNSLIFKIFLNIFKFKYNNIIIYDINFSKNNVFIRKILNKKII